MYLHHSQTHKHTDVRTRERAHANNGSHTHKDMDEKSRTTLVHCKYPAKCLSTEVPKIFGKMSVFHLSCSYMRFSKEQTK